MEQIQNFSRPFPKSPIAFEMFMPTIAEVVSTFLCWTRGAIDMDDINFEKFLFYQGHYRLCKDGVKASIVHPPSESSINSRVMDFRLTVSVHIDGEFLPWAPQI